MPRADRVPFLPGRRLIAVPAVINELVSVSLVADSGAQRTLISRDVAQGLNLGRQVGVQTLLGVGQSSPVPYVLLDQLRWGTMSV